MTIKPILFSGPMVRALLEGRKTQTRRVVAKLRRFGEVSEFGRSDTYGYEWHFRDKGLRWHDLRGPMLMEHLPYAVGDLLWVRETWAVSAVYDGLAPRDLIPNFCKANYAADDAIRGCKARPSIHMPRWVSRLTLEVTGLKVERLQDIDAADAQAEGVEFETADPPFYYVPGIWPHAQTAVGVEEPGGRHAERSFAKLWDTINGKDPDKAWSANPWVFAVIFKVHRCNVDELVAKEAA